MSTPSRNVGVVHARKYLKHSFSCLPDGLFEIEIDHLEQVVTVASERFDSSLVGWLITSILPESHGVVAFRDDNQGWHPPLPAYALRIRVGAKGPQAVEFDASVVRLCNAIGAGVAVSLTSPRWSSPPGRGWRGRNSQQNLDSWGLEWLICDGAGLPGIRTRMPTVGTATRHCSSPGMSAAHISRRRLAS